MPIQESHLPFIINDMTKVIEECQKQDVDYNKLKGMLNNLSLKIDFCLFDADQEG